MMIGIVLSGPVSALGALVCELAFTGGLTWYAPLLVGMATPVLLVAGRLAAEIVLSPAAGAPPRIGRAP